MLGVHAEAPYLSDAQASGKTMDYEQFKIKSYKHWDLYLHENQCYLGRVFVLLKDEGVEDFLAIEGETRKEFFQIGEDVKKALKILFQPDKMNYAALSNTSPVIHVHIVPRYKETREFAGLIFTDTRWGKNYAPYDRSFVLEESILFKIRDAIKHQIKA
jgi:diadenosine tetraphosphate (Ap4A) HIT family hydrolase